MYFVVVVVNFTCLPVAFGPLKTILYNKTVKPSTGKIDLMKTSVLLLYTMDVNGRSFERPSLS